VVALDVRERAGRSRRRSASARSRPESEKLIGYLIISRYVDAWHVMNVGRRAGHRRRGIASLLLNRLFELTAGRSRRGYTLEVRVSNAGAIKLYEELGFRPRGVRAATTRTTARTP
jgi:ribosomal-protein-alanine N-acetyltransferase